MSLVLTIKKNQVVIVEGVKFFFRPHKGNGQMRVYFDAPKTTRINRTKFFVEENKKPDSK